MEKLQVKVGQPPYIDINRLQLIGWCRAQAQARREGGNEQSHLKTKGPLEPPKEE